MIRSHPDYVDVKYALSLAIAGLVLVGGLFISTPPAVEYRLQVLFAIFAMTVVLWITKPVPYSISSVLAVVLLYGLGVTETFQAAVIGFASELVFFLILLLLLGKSIDKVGLDDWIAEQLVTTGGSPRTSIRRLTSGFLVLAFLMPSATARTVTLMPVVDRINSFFRLDSGSSFRRTSYYTLGHANPIVSGAIMTGGGMPIVTAELINSYVEPITWVEWLVYMLPTAFAFFIVGVYLVSFIYSVSTETKDGEDGGLNESDDDSPLSADGGTDGTGSTDSQDDSAGDDEGEQSPVAAESMTWKQQFVLATIVLAIAFWVIGSFLGIPTIIPAMFAVFLLALPGVRVITPTELGSISWGIVFLIGAMLSIIDAMEELGGFELIVASLFSVISVDALGLLVVIGLLLAFSLFVRATFSSSSAAILILFPIMFEFAQVLGLNPMYLAFGLLFVLTSGIFFPFNVSTVLLAYERGPLTLKEVFLLSVLNVCLACLIVTLSWLVYWPLAGEFVSRFL